MPIRYNTIVSTGFSNLWLGREDLNLQPFGSEPTALPVVLRPNNTWYLVRFLGVTRFLLPCRKIPSTALSLSAAAH